MNTKIAITLGAMALSVVSGAAYAGSITVPGETSGIAIGAPLPEGVYFVDTSGFGASRGGSKNWSDFSIPVIAWSTPWQFLGGRIEAYAAAPVIAFGNTAYGDQTPASFNKAIYNPALFVGEAWKLGDTGWNFSQFFGGYAPVDNAINQDFWTFNSRSAITYNADNWNLTAHVIYGITGEQLSGPNQGLKTNPDYVNLDLTATKTFGKWEVGAVAFGSWDVSTTDLTDREQSQFAIGGLIGYNFTGISLQAYLTHDIWTENYFSPTDACIERDVCEKAYETRFWTRVVIPLWSPPAEELAPVTYKK